MTEPADSARQLHAALDQLVRAHEAELRRLQADHANQIAALTATYRAAIDELRDQHSTEPCHDVHVHHVVR